MYKEQFPERYAVPVSRYLNEAASCKISNGDASKAVETLLPPQLALISRFEFGYVLNLGKSRPAESIVVHGYASTDPTLAQNVPPALEFVSILVRGQARSFGGEYRKAGTWRIGVDPAEEFDKHFNAQARKQGAEIQFDMTDFVLEQTLTANVDQSAKLALIESLQRQVAAELRREGFEQLTGADIRRSTGMSIEDILKDAAGRLPFGYRRSAPKLGRTFLVLVNEKRPSCTKSGSGAMGAYIMAMQPEPGVDADYGSVSLIVAGFGSCARRTTTTRTYMDGLIEVASDQLQEALSRR